MRDHARRWLHALALLLLACNTAEGGSADLKIYNVIEEPCQKTKTGGETVTQHATCRIIIHVLNPTCKSRDLSHAYVKYRRNKRTTNKTCSSAAVETPPAVKLDCSCSSATRGQPGCEQFAPNTSCHCAPWPKSHIILPPKLPGTMAQNWSHTLVGPNKCRSIGPNKTCVICMEYDYREDAAAGSSQPWGYPCDIVQRVTRSINAGAPPANKKFDTTSMRFCGRRMKAAAGKFEFTSYNINLLVKGKDQHEETLASHTTTAQSVRKRPNAETCTPPREYAACLKDPGSLANMSALDQRAAKTTCCTNFNDDNSDGQTDCDPRGDCAKALKHGGGAQSLKYTIKCRLCKLLPDATFLAKVAVVVQACCVSDAHNGAGAIPCPSIQRSTAACRRQLCDHVYKRLSTCFTAAQTASAPSTSITLRNTPTLRLLAKFAKLVPLATPTLAKCTAAPSKLSAPGPVPATAQPSARPSASPSWSPSSARPSWSPSHAPRSAKPTAAPAPDPTASPTAAGPRTTPKCGTCVGCMHEKCNAQFKKRLLCTKNKGTWCPRSGGKGTHKPSNTWNKGKGNNNLAKEANGWTNQTNCKTLRINNVTSYKTLAMARRACASHGKGAIKAAKKGGCRTIMSTHVKGCSKKGPFVLCHDTMKGMKFNVTHSQEFRTCLFHKAVPTRSPTTMAPTTMAPNAGQSMLGHNHHLDDHTAKPTAEEDDQRLQMAVAAALVVALILLLLCFFSYKFMVERNKHTVLSVQLGQIQSKREYHTGSHSDFNEFGTNDFNSGLDNVNGSARSNTKLSFGSSRVGPASPSGMDGHEDARKTFNSASMRNDIIEVLKKTSGKTPWNNEIISNDEADELTLQEEIGKGSYGTVFKGNFRGHYVAVKEFKWSNITTEEFKLLVADFKNEVSTCCALSHKNVVQFYGYTTKPHVWMIQELAASSLYAVLHNPEHAVDEAMKLGMALDTACGMGYLHGLNPPIVHRDLKSLNLLVFDNMDVKITDFGLARAKAMGNTGDTYKMTQIGTPYWTAPEVFNDDVYNEKVDVYSFAICLWEVWTRQTPWEGVPPVQVAVKVVTEGLRPPVPDCMELDIQDLMTTCWSHDPKSRPSFEQVVGTLEDMKRSRMPVHAHGGMHGGDMARIPESSRDGHGSRSSYASSNDSMRFAAEIPDLTASFGGGSDSGGRDSRDSHSERGSGGGAERRGSSGSERRGSGSSRHSSNRSRSDSSTSNRTRGSPAHDFPGADAAVAQTIVEVFEPPSPMARPDGTSTPRPEPLPDATPASNPLGLVDTTASNPLADNRAFSQDMDEDMTPRQAPPPQSPGGGGAEPEDGIAPQLADDLEHLQEESDDSSMATLSPYSPPGLE